MSAPDPRQFYTKIQDVQSRFGGLTQTSQFMVNLGLNSGSSIYGQVEGHLSNANVFDDRNGTSDFNFFCSDATLPGSAFDVMEVQGARQGLIERMPNRRVYTDFDLTFYVDSEYKILRLFEEWMNYIDPITNADGQYLGDPRGMTGFGDPNCFYRLRYPNSYKRPIVIHKFERGFLKDKSMNKFSSDLKEKRKSNILSYIFLEAFPTNIQAIPFSYDGSTLTKVSVNFSYTRYLVTQNAGIGRGASGYSDTLNPSVDVDAPPAPLSLDAPFGTAFDSIYSAEAIGGLAAQNFDLLAGFNDISRNTVDFSFDLGAASFFNTTGASEVSAGVGADVAPIRVEPTVTPAAAQSAARVEVIQQINSNPNALSSAQDIQNTSQQIQQLFPEGGNINKAAARAQKEQAEATAALARSAQSNKKMHFGEALNRLLTGSGQWSDWF